MYGIIYLYNNIIIVLIKHDALLDRNLDSSIYPPKKIVSMYIYSVYKTS